MLFLYVCKLGFYRNVISGFPDSEKRQKGVCWRWLIFIVISFPVWMTAHLHWKSPLRWPGLLWKAGSGQWWQHYTAIRTGAGKLSCLETASCCPARAGYPPAAWPWYADLRIPGDSETTEGRKVVYPEPVPVSSCGV